MVAIGERAPAVVSQSDFFRRELAPRLRVHGRTFVVDAAIVAAAYGVAEAVRFDGSVPANRLSGYYVALVFIVLVYGAINYVFGIHRQMWQYAGMQDVQRLLAAGVVSAALFGVADDLKPGPRMLPFSVIVAGSVFAVGGMLGARLWRRLLVAPSAANRGRARVLIVGAGQAGQMVAAELLRHPGGAEVPVGFVDDDPAKQTMRIKGIPVLGVVDELPEIVARHTIDIVGLAVPSATKEQRDRILCVVEQTEARIQILPSLSEIINGRVPVRLRDINLDELLNRTCQVSRTPGVDHHLWLAGRTVLVTGGAGSIGSELCRQLVALGPARVLALDNNETGLFHLEREVGGRNGGCPLIPVLADITDEVRLGQVFTEHCPDVVFHAAAYKHVNMLELHPEQAVLVNACGTLNLCRIAREHGCQRFVFVSTDKAVRPVSVLGYSKRIGELIARAHAGGGTIFCSVRFGNVIGSRGSALPEFIRQIDEGEPVTVTHPDVERYFMTISEAVSLVIHAAALAKGGELFMLDMGEPVKIVDLVHQLIRWRGLRVGSDVEIVFTGLRHGEKLTEDLNHEEEETGPTPHPAIRVVRDTVEVRSDDLMRNLSILEGAAMRGSREAASGALRAVAYGETPHFEEKVFSKGA